MKTKNKIKEVRFTVSNGSSTYFFDEDKKAIRCAERLKTTVYDKYTKKVIADFTKHTYTLTRLAV